MDVRFGLEQVVPPDRPRAVAVGVFDGVHLGHQRLIRRATARARRCGGESLVLTFDPHPRSILCPDTAPRLLTLLPDKSRLIAALGAHTLVVARFDEGLARRSPEEFVAQVLKEALGADSVFVGFNFTFGHRGAGDAASLQRLGRAAGIEVNILEPICVEGITVSSTTVRHLIASGSPERAHPLLGRPYTLAGRVVRGEGRGRGLGFPTANVAFDPRLVVPAPGVYAVWAYLGGRRLPGVANAGRRPTFGRGLEMRLEVHLLDRDDDLYGEELAVEFIARLRGEHCFPDEGTLAARIGQDIAQARRVLGIG